MYSVLIVWLGEGVGCRALFAYLIISRGSNTHSLGFKPLRLVLWLFLLYSASHGLSCPDVGMFSPAGARRCYLMDFISSVNTINI